MFERMTNAHLHLTCNQPEESAFLYLKLCLTIYIHCILLEDLCARKYDESRSFMRDYLALDDFVKRKLWKRVSRISHSSIVL
jgi:hypothetical protein